MNLLRFSVLCSLLSLSLFTGGCSGYRLGSIKPAQLAHIESIAIPTFKNDTLEPRVQVLITNEVIKQMQRDGSFTIADVATADAILHATITTIDRRQLRTSRTDSLRTREIEIILNVTFSLEDSETGAELDRGQVSGRSSIFLAPNFQLSERQALQLAGEDLAATLTSRIAEGY